MNKYIEKYACPTHRTLGVNGLIQDHAILHMYRPAKSHYYSIFH